MKKMYFMVVFLILIITVGFLLFSCDQDTVNLRFLSSYGIEAYSRPIESEVIKLPEVFDEVYEGYNLLQLESGLDLRPYKGKRAERYSYKILNPQKDMPQDVRATVICVNRRPVAGDIISVSASGFILPLNYMLSY